MGFLSATDLDLYPLWAEVVGSVLDEWFGAAWFKDVVAVFAVGPVLVKVASWMLVRDLGCVAGLVLAEDLG